MAAAPRADLIVHHFWNFIPQKTWKHMCTLCLDLTEVTQKTVWYLVKMTVCCLSDPEEFLTVIMQHILALEPLLKLYS